VGNERDKAKLDPEPEVTADLEKEAANIAPTNDEL